MSQDSKIKFWPGTILPGALSENWSAALLLAAVTFVAHFLLLSQFGLYEDDYFYALPVFGWDWSTWWLQVQNDILHPVQGRPLFLAVNHTVMFLSLKLGGLEMAYLTGWAILSMNALLLFKFVERTVSTPAAIAAALFFIVYPIDTSRQILMHQVALHGGMFLLLCALHLYLRGWIVLSFVVAAAGLLNYESFYLPFLAAPLLVARLVKPTGWRLLKHVMLFFGVALALLLARRFMGESRATELLGGLGEVITKMLSAGPIGMWVAVKAAVLRPLDALLHSGPFACCLGLAVAAVTAGWLARVSRSDHSLAVPQPARPLIWVAAGGVLAWLISYLLAFRADYYPPIMSIGRLTGVHTPGTLGAALCVAVATEALRLQGGRRLRVGAAILFSLLIGFSAAFALQIQRSEYASHWSRQVAFYQQMVTLIADLREGEIVILDAEGDASVLPITQGFPRFGTVNYTPLAFAKYVTWPASWQTAPQIAVIWEGGPVQSVEQGLALFTPPWHFQPAASPPICPRIYQSHGMAGLST